MGRAMLQFIVLFAMLAGASVTSSCQEEPQEREHPRLMSELPSDQQALKEWGDPAEASMSLTGDVIRLANGTKLQLYPSTAEAHVQAEPGNGTTTATTGIRRRRLGVFRQCSPCTCCDKTRRWCLPTVCCYNIRCGLQGMPYGLCSFIPISCTCFGCRK